MKSVLVFLFTVSLLICSSSNVYAQKGASFRLDIQGVGVVTFQGCSGLGSTSEIIDHKIVDSQGREIVRKIPGRLENTTVTCERSITAELDLWAWRKLVEEGNVADARANIRAQALSSRGEVVADWTIKNGWPAALQGAAGTGGSVESVLIAHEGIERTL